MRAVTWLSAAATAACVMTRPQVARAEEPGPRPWDHLPAATVLGTAAVGDGLRFNNPYRLATPLGATAQSVSRTAGFVDAGFAAVYGDARGLEHGLALRMTFATEGVPQAVLVPTYLLWRRFRDFAAYGRLGPAIVLTPDVTWGGELSVGGAWFLRGGVGVAAEIVGDVFYGAGTRDVATPAYPVLSGELGVVVAYEVLP
jgi:hypothetical protein